jgi:NADH:ubiquinone oxidoreductase subunit 3 (subunit A)
MLYWGMFTAGFIVGGILASYLLSPKTEKRIKRNSYLSGVNLSNTRGMNSDQIFSNITKVNYFSKN